MGGNNRLPAMGRGGGTNEGCRERIGSIKSSSRIEGKKSGDITQFFTPSSEKQINDKSPMKLKSDLKIPQGKHTGSTKEGKSKNPNSAMVISGDSINDEHTAMDIITQENDDNMFTNWSDRNDIMKSTKKEKNDDQEMNTFQDDIMEKEDNNYVLTSATDVQHWPMRALVAVIDKWDDLVGNTTIDDYKKYSFAELKKINPNSGMDERNRRKTYKFGCIT